MARFFIDRPIFAWVIAIVIMLGGGLAITTLSIAQYPDIAPTTIQIQARYPGASAETIENSVTKVIEQNLTGIDHLQYISSSSTSSGSATITITFTNDADADTAQVQVQNKLSLVTSQLPQIVQSLGVTVSKASESFLMVVALTSEDGTLSSNDLADYIISTLNDRIKRIEGVGSAQVFGGGYAMRIWLDPNKLAQFQLMPSDVSAAIATQNVQVSAGQLGGLPAVQGQQLNATISAQSRLQTPEQFRDIILKSDMRGSIVRVGDVARVELGADSYTSLGRYNGKPAAGLALNLAAGANAIRTATAVETLLKELEPTLPNNVLINYPYDTTPFVRLSIEEVVKTLLEAIVLVFLVMYLFLQNFRATLIPTIAVPVVLLGTFGVLSIFGYSINTLTMFAMVLAIGLLVDDAIVVVENVERVMAEEGLPPREATIKSMGEITGALVGIATVLSAVFVPMAFFGGSVGVIYRQFSVTIVSAMILSVLVALVLTPALCATMLKHDPNHGAPRRGFFGWFNRMFGKATNGYIGGVRRIVRLPAIFLVLFALIVGGAGWLFNKLPGSFIPEEDQGVLFVIAQLPTGATQDRTSRVLETIRRHFSEGEKDSVEGVFDVAGFSFAGQGQNVGMAFVKLKDFSLRKDPRMRASAIALRANMAFFGIRDAMAFALAPPALPGIGTSSGFEMYLQDAAGAGHEKLMQARNMFLGLAAQNPRLANTRPNGQEDQPQFAVEIDNDKARAYALNLADVNATLSIAWAGSYVNDFIDRGRVKSVYLQSDAPFRMLPENLNDWYVRNAAGGMVPFSAISSGKWTYGSPNLQRFNGVSAVQIQGQAAPGVSSGEAMDVAQQLVSQLPQGFTNSWSGLSFQERLSGNQATALYAISVLVVFLCLAALYESWSIPFSVMMAVPLGVFGALLSAILAHQSNDVYFKVGLLTTIGLAAKNAILIVEFAIEQQARGKGLVEATLEACRQRLRPILMTSFAFILGVLPLTLANGAGSGAQNSIGFGVMGGMIAATALGIFFVPLLFYTVRRIFKGGRTVAPAAPPPARDEPAPAA